MRARLNTLTPPMIKLLCACAILTLAAGCDSSRASGSSDAGADDGSVAIDATSSGDAVNAGAWRFVPDDLEADQAAVRLEATVDGDHATLRVLAQNIAQVQGVAFRLQLAPDRVALQSSDASDAWFTPLAAKFHARPDGELWVGIGHVGRRGLPATSPTVLARFALTLSGDDPLPVTFRPQHGTLLAPGGEHVELKWAGGHFERQN